MSVEELSQSLLWLTGAAVAAIVGMVVMSKYFGSLPILKHLLLEPPTTVMAEAGVEMGVTDRPLTEAEMPISVGEEGVADSALRPAGRVLFGERYRDVVTDGSFVEKGAQVRVIKVSGIHITVRQIS